MHESADKTVRGKTWKRRAEKPGRENFLISIKFSFFFTAASGSRETRRQRFRAGRASKSAPSSLPNEPGDDDWKTQTELETGKEKHRERAKECGLTWDSLAVLSPVYLGRRCSFRSAVKARYPACLHLLRLRLHQDRRRACEQKDHTGFFD